MVSRRASSSVRELFDRHVGTTPGEHGAVRLGDGQGAVGGELQSPPALVHDVMVSRARWYQVRQVREPADLPRDDVVDLAAVEGDVATTEGACAVDRPERPALGPVGVAGLAAHVERVAVPIDDHRRDASLAAEPLDRRRWEFEAVSGLADAVVVQLTGACRAGVDEQGDVGFEWAGLLVATGDEPAECLGGETVAVDRARDEVGIAAAGSLGDHRSDFAVDRPKDLVGQLGVEREAALDHAGAPVDLARDERVATLLVVAPDPVIAFEQPSEVTDTGLVEPMRTDDAHQRRGLARHILTTGIDLLARAGATRIKICHERDNPASEHLYLGVGFEPDRRTGTFSGPTRAPAAS